MVALDGIDFDIIDNTMMRRDLGPGIYSKFDEQPQLFLWAA
jgi:hypothetical protein